MKSTQQNRKIYRFILDALDKEPLKRQDIIRYVTESYNLSEEEMKNTETNGRLNVLRSATGIIINEMLASGIISKDRDELYYRSAEKPIAIRIERCEEEILLFLKDGRKSRTAIKEHLIKFFGTDETESVKDDNKLFTYIGHILKKLTSEKILDCDGTVYSIAPEKMAMVKNRSEVLALKGDFLSLVHSKGGEFFEHYFMNLIEKYLIRCGKTVTESYVTGGAADGGIDGVIKTIDSLGFRETVMVQTKNRNELTPETDVRGFYGAVCAAQGSRGIFVTTSDFHPVAKTFLDSIDNCVGINGDKIFSMATDTSYGIKRRGDRLVIDLDVLEV